MIKQITNNKNYYNSEEQKSWPEKLIVECQEVPNIYDYRGHPAVKATLECGHFCFLTGEAIYTQRSIHCKPCGEIMASESIKDDGMNHPSKL